MTSSPGASLSTLPSDDLRQIMWRFADRYELHMLVQAARGEQPSSGRDDHATIVRPGTLELVEESDDAWHFAFEPADDEDEESREFMRHVEGRLVVRKSGHYVETISLRNEKPIRPMPGVKISTFETLIEFGPAVPGGPIVPRSIDVRVRGRAFLAIGFDETESIRFSAWEYAGRAE